MNLSIDEEKNCMHIVKETQYLFVSSTYSVIVVIYELVFMVELILK